MFRKLDRFRLGKIRAEGFLKEQLLRGKDGMAGHLFELEPGMIRDPYIQKTYVPAWGDGDQSGWGAEISGNYWTGYIQHAFTLDDQEMIAVATSWVESMMTHQRPDGYLGTYYEPDADIYDDYNAWGVSCAMRGLIAFYEATGRQDVLDAVHRNMLWFCENWAGEKKTAYAGPFIIEPMIQCYEYTLDERLVRFSEEYEDFLCRHDLFKQSYKAYLEEDLHYFSNHTVAVGNQGRMPAVLYSANGKKEYLRATERLLTLLREKCIQPTGGPVSFAEYLGPKCALGETEYCSFAAFNATYSAMACITGEAKYGEYMEEMFYNAAQGARKKDEKAIAYMSAPNQIFATETSSTGGPYKDMQVYAPCYPVACCPVNSVVLVPEFVRALVLHDAAGDLFLPAYGPCVLEDEGVRLTEDTLYPFRSRVRLTVESGTPRSVFCRIPSWADDLTIRLDGKTIRPASVRNGYAEVPVQAGCAEIMLTFGAKPVVLRVDDSDMSKKYPLCIRFGALVFAYHIPELWNETPGHPMTPLPEGWHWYNVSPGYPAPEGGDPHENMARKRDAITWNVALEESLSPESITVEEVEPSGYVWENPPIRLHLTCYKAPFLCASYPSWTMEPFGDRQFVTEKLPLTLVPYGCTNLRITFFPRAELKNGNQR